MSPALSPAPSSSRNTEQTCVDTAAEVADAPVLEKLGSTDDDVQQVCSELTGVHGRYRRLHLFFGKEC